VEFDIASWFEGVVAASEESAPVRDASAGNLVSMDSKSDKGDRYRCVPC
jgi:hypothetical protein